MSSSTMTTTFGAPGGAVGRGSKKGVESAMVVPSTALVPVTDGNRTAGRAARGTRDHDGTSPPDPPADLSALRGDVRPRGARRRRPGRADPRRPRRRVEQGLPLPEGHDARTPAPRPRPPAHA